MKSAATPSARSSAPRVLAARQFDFYSGDRSRLLPFFSAFAAEGYDLEAITATVFKEGWTEDWRMSVEYFDELASSGALGAGITLDHGEVTSDASIRRRVLELSRIVFGMPDELIDALDRINREAPCRGFAVVARDLTGRDVAAGLVYVKGDTAFLTGAATLEECRGRGLWRQLLRRRQELSFEVGARHWFYDTVNRNIMGKGCQQTEMITFVKRS